MVRTISYSDAGKLGAAVTAEIAHKEKQKRIDDYNKNPTLCAFCKKALEYEKRKNKFCSHTCSAKFNNIGITRNPKNLNRLEVCLCCGKKLGKGQFKYCSNECSAEAPKSNRLNKILLSGVDTSHSNKTYKRYLIELHEGKCQICGLSEWLEKPMPLVIDHIDGNHYNNALTNLRVICNNCDALLPTYKNSNKGKGRYKRAERYKIEKEMYKNVSRFDQVLDINNIRLDSLNGKTTDL